MMLFPFLVPCSFQVGCLLLGGGGPLPWGLLPGVLSSQGGSA